MITRRSYTEWIHSIVHEIIQSWKTNNKNKKNITTIGHCVEEKYKKKMFKKNLYSNFRGLSTVNAKNEWKKSKKLYISLSRYGLIQIGQIKGKIPSKSSVTKSQKKKKE